MSSATNAEHLLGVSCYEKQDYAGSVIHYLSALNQYQQDGNQEMLCTCRYHLALSYAKLGDTQKTIDNLQAILIFHPQHFATLFMLGSEYMKEQRYELAIENFKIAEKVQINHIELQINLAHCYFSTQQYLLARDSYYYALELNPNLTEAHFNLGVLCTKEGLVNQAINHYLDAIAIDNKYFDAHYNLGLLFLEKRHASKATRHLQAALTIKPDHQGAAFLLGISQNEKHIEQVPLSHIQTLFDQYADTYDKHLVIALDYQLPSQLFAFHQALFPNTTYAHALDLGCGTGLCGEAFKPIVNHLNGVDLSEKMLDEARKKGIYRQLYRNDLLSFFKEHKQSYSLIFAGDVFVYIGDLNAVFASIRQHIEPYGKLLFNIEEGSTPPYVVDQSGRFLHHPSYILQVAEHHHFTIERAMSATTRQQNNQPVHGLLYCLSLSPEPIR
jgi:predicted TPR repeat methyltransferase